MERSDLVIEFQSAGQELLGPIRGVVAAYLRYVGMGEDAVYDLVTAVDETVSNSIRHAYDGGEGPVRLEVSRNSSKAVVRVRDWGKQLDPQLLKAPVDVEAWAAEGKEGGMGFAFITALVDSMSLEKRKEGKVIVLEKRM